MTERIDDRDDVSLRPWRPDDRDLLVSLLVDPDVRRFVGGALEPSEARRRAVALLADVPAGYFVVIHGTSAVGTLTFDRKRGPWEVSFQLSRAAWGNGIMPIALRRAISWFRTERPQERLIAVTQRENLAARRTIESAAGVQEREFEQYGAHQIQYRLSMGTAS